MIDLNKYKGKTYGVVYNQITGKYINIDKVILGFFKFIEYFGNLYKGGLYEEQKIIAAELISNALRGNLGLKGQDIYINITRQFGKSFIVFSVIAYILYVFPDLVGKKNYSIGVTFNKIKQAKKNFNELRKVLSKSCPHFGMSMNEDNVGAIELSNGSKVNVFSMEAGNNAGDTLDLIIDDESQDLNWDKYTGQIEPMGLRTGAIKTYIGVGGKQRNGFYDQLQNVNNNIFKLDYDDVIEISQKRYEETGDIRHLMYKQGIEEQLSNGKISQDVFKTEYKLEWLLGLGNFITLEELSQHRGQDVYDIKYNGICYAGLDYAKMKDFSILTIVAVIDGKLKILRWEKMNGDYKVQFEKVGEILRQYNIGKLFVDATGVGGGITDFLYAYIPGIPVELIVFSQSSKHTMYSNLMLVFQEGYEYPVNSHTKTFEKEFTDLQKEYKSNYLSCHHPEGDYHDDYCDSLALACMFKGNTLYYNGVC